jgi:hypothetical protein
LKNSGVVRRAAFRFSYDDEYIKFYNGWAKFVTDTGIDLNDLIIVQVKVTPSSIRLIVQVVRDPHSDSDSDSDDEELAFLF